ncbi:ArnT family glycosyltransferase [Pseudodonghicola xiamenensis]|uniref:Glycosyl transferase n=1 Tax=Pseudodonghicola xiamenensis TaxID=337702 RepID=A0A8J3MFE8_9RHOB|nr:glycosyltransferase family 39 protein [Pseudodonghicola xiamenensis]GHG94287.1 glycosyl transferase [Pseudodonghicola xiamenensis]
MQKSAPLDRVSDPKWIAIAIIAAITVYRVILLAFSQAELFVDESQYWQWGQELAWGYYSKPPLIGWVLRAFTELGGDTTFWIRLPGPLFQAATALILMGAARQVTDRRAAAMVAIAFVTLPAVTAGAFLVSTDTILLPFFAGALWLYLRLTATSSAKAAIGLGLCLGLGMLAKYAAVYFILSAGIGALVVPQARIAWRDAGIAALVFLVVIAPNVVWNLQNDLMTFSHTADNVDWVRHSGLNLHFNKALEFLVSQFGVMGPVFFGAFLWLAPRAFLRDDWKQRWLALMAAPTLILVTVQAILSKAYANWAITACLALLLLVVPVLWHRGRTWLWIALVLDMVLAAMLPIAFTQATRWTTPKGELLMRRYVGEQEMSSRILETARQQGVTAVVSDSRLLLADLFLRAKGGDIAIYAVPARGRPDNYYAQRHPYPAERSGPFLFATLDGAPACGEALPTATWIPGPGAYSRDTLQLYLQPRNCWDTAK